MRGRSRRPAREAVLRALYEVEVGHLPAETALADTLEHIPLDDELADFAREAVRGVAAHLSALDDALAQSLTDWDLSRVATVDRNVLRLAAFELFHCPSIPPAVTINEAVDLAKKFSTAESGRFVNGVLGKLLESTPKHRWDPASAPPDEQIVEAEPEPEPEVEAVSPDSDEAKELARAGLWTLRNQDEEKEEDA